jgi:hypothetical protein
MWIDTTMKIQRTVPIEMTGESVGVKLGGLLSWARRRLMVEALPADLPESISGDTEFADPAVGVQPMAMLVFDEESGDFIDVTGSDDSSAGEAPMPIDDTDTGEGDDWVVYTSGDTDSTVTSDQSESTDTSLSIAWDAEAEEVNDLLPPPPPGRSGMKHEQGASAP